MEEILIVTDDVRDHQNEAVLVINPDEGCFALKGDVFTDLGEIPGYYLSKMRSILDR